MNEELLIKITEKLDGLGKEFAELRNENKRRFDNVDQQFSTIDKRFDDADQRFTAIGQRFDDVDQQMERIDQKINHITEQVAKNSVQLTEHGEKLTPLSKARNVLIAGQQKQDKLLQTLAMRSLEQESDIRDLKRIK